MLSTLVALNLHSTKRIKIKYRSLDVYRLLSILTAYNLKSSGGITTVKVKINSSSMQSIGYTVLPNGKPLKIHKPSAVYASRTEYKANLLNQLASI